MPGDLNMKQALMRHAVKSAARRLDRAIEDMDEAIYDLATLKKKVSEEEADDLLLYMLCNDLGELSRRYDKWLASATAVSE